MTLAQVPRVIKIVGALVVEPEKNLGKAMWNAGRVIATADPATGWHCLDAAVTVAQTLRDTLTDLMGVPFTLTPPQEMFTDLPDEVIAGAHAGIRMVHDPHAVEMTAWHAAATSGTLNSHAVLGAYLMACLLAHQCILTLAHGTGLTPVQAWQRARPLLMP